MTRTLRLLAAALALLLLAAAWPARAQDVLPIPPLAGRVIDQTGTLDAAQQQALTQQLAEVEAQRGSQIVVLIVPTTAPEDIAAYAQRVGDTWKIGRRTVGDGLLIVVAKNDRRVRIEVAKALEGAVPDLAAKQIIGQAITPAFRQNDYAGGLRTAVAMLDARIGGEGLPLPEPERGAPERGLGGSGFGLEDLAIFLFVAVPVIGAVLTGIFGRKLGSLLTGGAAAGIGWWITASLLAAAGAGLLSLILVGVLGVGSARRGGRHGGFIPPIGWGGGGGGGGGGGFSSGGGGDFGGGGASGNW